MPDENLKNIFNRLCYTLDLNPPALKNVFRTHRRNNTDDPPVILQFASVRERNTVLKAVAIYRKQSNRSLCLHDLGFEGSNSKVFVNESLTQRNRSLLQHAVRMKKRKQLFAVYTKFGSVFIKISAKGESVAVDDLNSLCAAAERCQLSEDTAVTT